MRLSRWIQSLENRPLPTVLKPKTINFLNALNSGDGVTCEEVNECLLMNPTCGENAVCVDKFMGYDCVCRDGYSGDGQVCVMDELCASEDIYKVEVEICRNSHEKGSKSLTECIKKARRSKAKKHQKQSKSTGVQLKLKHIFETLSYKATRRQTKAD